MALIDHFFTTSRGANRSRRTGLMTYLALWRSRRALARLDARALEDIGVTRDAADLEANRNLWDVPNTWKNQ
ncbi:DUF1127 domain-containing protein [uncultured Roseobacter sp.]|uniref:DUF1127 domain-containing protein n=1 Tax=uncultured Roseobacter sp. TaxID=114847 RepID=UPI00260795A3|nr:DUF1127 domain-containing protein [uncultured Roseobacter sp.]